MRPIPRRLRTHRAASGSRSTSSTTSAQPSSTEPNTVAPDHSAVFTEATVYFVWTQATADPVDLGGAVKRLLDAEVATSAAWPSDARIRLAPSLAAIDRSIARLRQTLSLSEQLKRGMLRFLAECLRHPVTAVRLLAQLLRPREHVGADNPGPNIEDSHSSLDSTLAEIDSTLLEAQKVSMAERLLDAEMFGGQAQREDHYVRLLLRSTHHEIDLTGSEYRVTVEPRLLLHRDGALQLVIGISAPSEVSTADLIAASYPSNPYLVRSHIPEPYAHREQEWAGGDWEDEEAGVRVRSISHDTGATIYDYIDMLTTRVFRIIRSRPIGISNCYPIVMARAGECCDDWRASHQTDLEQVAARSISNPGSRLTLGTGPDFSVHSDHVFYVNLASALVVYWRQWTPGIQDLNVTLLIEHTMLVYTRLSRLEVNVRRFPTGRRELLRAYRTALELAQDARGATIRWGTARDISRYLLAQLGAAELRATIEHGLSMAGERATALASERTARSANRLALLGVLIAVFAAIPSLPRILELIAQEHKANPDATVWSIIQTLATSPQLLAALVLAAALGYLLAGAVIAAARIVRHLLSLRRRGYASYLTGYEVVSTEQDDEELNGRGPAPESSAR